MHVLNIGASGFCLRRISFINYSCTVLNGIVLVKVDFLLHFKRFKFYGIALCCFGVMPLTAALLPL